MTSQPRILIAPNAPTPAMLTAVERGGGVLAVRPSEADALVWNHSSGPVGLGPLLADGPGIRWVQLPFAGIGPFLPLIDESRIWTCGKGVYAEPVAEMALGLLLAGMRHIAGYARERCWSAGQGASLMDARVTIVGGGGITHALLPMLAPFRARITVVRRQEAPIVGVERVLPTAQLREAVSGADAVVLALALTPQTEHIVDASVLATMEPHAWLVNVARGRHVDTDALVAALAAGTIGGAALDVTDPEPLPDGHPLWSLPNCLITPHTANTPEMAAPLLAARTETNVSRFTRGEELIGLVDFEAGY